MTTASFKTTALRWSTGQGARMGKQMPYDARTGACRTLKARGEDDLRKGGCGVRRRD